MGAGHSSVTVARGARVLGNHTSWLKGGEYINQSRVTVGGVEWTLANQTSRLGGEHGCWRITRHSWRGARVLTNQASRLEGERGAGQPNFTVGRRGGGGGRESANQRLHD